MTPAPTNRLNPQTWVMLGTAGLLLALAPLPLHWQAGLLVLLVGLHIFGRTLVPWLRLALVGLLPVATIAFTIQLISHGGQTVWTSWAPTGFMVFNLTAEGARYGLRLALQILGFGTACSLLILPTGSQGLRAALHTWRFPPRLVYLLVASLNAPAQLAHYSGLIRQAARARGMDKPGRIHGALLGVRTATALFTLLLLDYETRGRTLTDRNLLAPGPRTLWQGYPDSTGQRLVRLSALALAVVLIFCSYLGVLP